MKSFTCTTSQLLIGVFLISFFAYCQKDPEIVDDEDLSRGGLIAHWSLDGHGKDSSGNDHHASLSNVIVTADRFGRAGGACYFNGINAYGSVADSKDLRLNNMDFTLNAWLRLDSYNSSYGSNILSKHIAGANNGWGWSICGYASPQTGPAFYGPGGGSVNAVGAKVVTLSDWHMVTMVYSITNKKLSIYVDGALDTEISGIQTPNQAIDAALFIGKDEPTGKYYFKGALDDIKILGKALNGSEVEEYYKATRALPTDLIAYWPMDGNGNDVSGNGNKATFYNVTPIEDRMCRTGGALYFNGVSSYGTVADKSSLRLNGTDFTLSAWIKMEQYNTSYGSNILSKHIAGANNGWGWSICGYASPATGPLFYGPGGGSINAVGQKIVTLNEWHLLTSVYKASTGGFYHYIDGQLDNVSNGILSPNAIISAMLYIGKDEATNLYYYKGAMDDVKIYGKALSGSEVKQFYDFSKGQCNQE